MKINLAYAPDDKYSAMALVSMMSALESNKNNNVEIIILYSNLSDTSLKSFEVLKKHSNCILRYVKVDENYFNDFPISFWVTVQTWFRTKISELCPDLERVLYLDCDTIVRAPLDELFSIDLSDNLIAGIPDIWGIKSHTKYLKINDNEYFNAGVLLLNCKEWRNQGTFDKIKEFAINNKKLLKCSDQDALNKIADNKKYKLDIKYDYMETWWRRYYNEYENEGLIQYFDAGRNPVIVHFTGLKPQYYNCFNSFKYEWWQYAKNLDSVEELYNKFLEDEKIFKNECRAATVIKFLFYKILWKLTFTKKRKEYKNKAENIKNAMDNYKIILELNFKVKQLL